MRRSSYTEGAEISIKQALHLARIRLTANLIFSLKALSFHPKVTLISNSPISLFYQEVPTIYYHHCYYGISINSFHCGLRKHFVENQRKICHVSIQTYGRKKSLITSNQSLPSLGGIHCGQKQFMLHWTKIVHRCYSSRDSKITPSHLISQN